MGAEVESVARVNAALSMIDDSMMMIILVCRWMIVPVGDCRGGHKMCTSIVTRNNGFHPPIDNLIAECTIFE